VDNGDVVGIINMVFVKGTKESAISQPSGITYAIPANFIRQLVQRQK
jgi:S1-C subfamily serine protease